MKYGKQPMLIEKNRNFEDINNFKIIENMLALDNNEFMNMEENDPDEHLNFQQFSRPPSKIEKLPLIKKSIELNSKSEFMYKHSDSESHTMSMLEKMSLNLIHPGHSNINNSTNQQSYGIYNGIGGVTTLNNAHGLSNTSSLKGVNSISHLSPIPGEKNWKTNSNYISNINNQPNNNILNGEILIIENSGMKQSDMSSYSAIKNSRQEIPYPIQSQLQGVLPRSGNSERSEEKPQQRFPRDVFSINAKRKFVV
jgi:hypothetical protein